MGQISSELDVGAAITRLTTAVGERVLAVRAASGLTAAQLQVLRLARDGIALSALPTALHAPKSTVTSVVDQLESMGLAVRSSDHEDRRRGLVRSTPEGAARLADFDRELSIRIDALLAGLDGPRSRRLRELLSRLPDAQSPVPLVGPR